MTSRGRNVVVILVRKNQVGVLQVEIIEDPANR